VILTRREFLKLGGNVFTVSIAPTIGTVAQAHASESSEAQRRTLAAVAQTLFPIQAASDQIYDPCVAALGNLCAVDPSADVAVRVGVAKLSGPLGEPFHTRPGDARVAALKRLESTEFFAIAYRVMSVALFAQPLAWTVMCEGAGARTTPARRRS
jgi:hypothetical protein